MLSILGRALCVLLLLTAASTLFGDTWYVRRDGGDRGQCDGKGDAPYPGIGVRRHCALKDYRYLYDSHSYNNNAWVIAGGDTVIIRDGPWRVGWDAASGIGSGATWCKGMSNTSCSNPVIPAGTPARHTRILGEHFADCSNGDATNNSKLTQIFGGFGVNSVLTLNGAQYVDVQCLEITSHSQCLWFGIPGLPRHCKTSLPPEDFDSNGIRTDVHTHDLLLQDLWIHGHTSRGIIGPIGGEVTATRVDIAINGGAGWDFDDGKSTASINGVWNFNYSTIEWSGCNQIYPSPHVDTCYGQSTGGYGDGVGTPARMCLSANIDHSTFRYNTQDGLDLGHVDTGACPLRITNSIAYGNSGAGFKWGPNANPAVFKGNKVIANCMRLHAPIAGAAASYNSHLSDFCRAEDAISFNFRQGGKVEFTNNTIVTYAPTTFDIDCRDAEGCSNSTLIFKQNIVLGYDNPDTYGLGGEHGGPGGFYFAKPIGHFVRSANLYYGLRSSMCGPAHPDEKCADPRFLSQPRFSSEQDLDKFDFRLTSGSPASGLGAN
jgi:hypothetical protein